MLHDKLKAFSQEGVIIRHQHKGVLYMPDMSNLSVRTARLSPPPHPDSKLIILRNCHDS